MRIIVPGVTHTLTFTTRNDAGALADVSDATAYFYNFADTLQTTATPIRVGVGQYTVAFNESWAAGTYHAFITGTISTNTVASDIISFNVRALSAVRMYAGVEEFIKYANITSKVANGEIDLQYLKDLLFTSSERIEKYCSRRFYTYTVTAEKQAVNNDTVMFLSEYPIISITSITIRPFDNTTNDSIIASDEYEMDTYSGRLRFDDLRSGEITVTYTAGMSDTPEEVHMTCMDLAGYYLSRRMKAGVDNESLLGYSYDFVDDAENSILKNLNAFRLVRIV